MSTQVSRIIKLFNDYPPLPKVKLNELETCRTLDARQIEAIADRDEINIRRRLAVPLIEEISGS